MSLEYKQQSCCSCDKIFPYNELELIDQFYSFFICLECVKKPKKTCVKCSEISVKSTECLCEKCININMKSTINKFELDCTKCKKLKTYIKIGAPSSLGYMDKLLFICKECKECNECN